MNPIQEVLVTEVLSMNDFIIRDGDPEDSITGRVQCTTRTQIAFLFLSVNVEISTG